MCADRLRQHRHRSVITSYSIHYTKLYDAVDQALLELRPNNSWNLLEALLQKRGYLVETATAQSQVIGKRHFGKKALPPGGGGGRAPARELFDTLLTWQPRVKLDANGNATLKVASYNFV